MSDCVAKCAGLRDPSGFSADTLTGDSLDCRLAHIALATVDSAQCTHAGRNHSA